MGRSLSPIATESTATARGKRTEQIAAFDAGPFHYTIEHRDGRLFHRESAKDEQGRPGADVEAEIAYALGSGKRGVSYLIEQAGSLYQSPISWYTQKARWDLSPGYERNNMHFDRPILPNCLFCHSNRVAPVPMTTNRYEVPVFKEGYAIGCERCHGPGELHLQSQAVVDGRDLTIVNPRHLEPSLRTAVCEQCHLLGERVATRPQGSIFDFRPGLPTSEFFLVVERNFKQNNRAVGQVEQMKLSRCYQATQGLLGCTSCHDPHRAPAQRERVAYYRQKCLVCHEQRGCGLPHAERSKQSPDDSCILCHMPVLKDRDIAHVATTNHRIPRS